MLKHLGCSIRVSPALLVTDKGRTFRYLRGRREGRVGGVGKHQKKNSSTASSMKKNSVKQKANKLCHRMAEKNPAAS